MFLALKNISHQVDNILLCNYVECHVLTLSNFEENQNLSEKMRLITFSMENSRMSFILKFEIFFKQPTHQVIENQIL